MSNITKGGIIGLGSRLFLRRESDWGEGLESTQALSHWEQYNIYNQAGSRPQKTTTPIEVSQLYPSVVRRKTILNTSEVAGSFVFSLPKTKNSVFWQMITGDETSSAGAVLTPKSPVTDILSTADGFLTILLDANTNATTSLVGKNVTISGITTDDSGDDDDLELAIVNSTHSITAHNIAGLLLTTATTFDVADFAGTVTGTASLKVGGGGYDLQESNDVSYSFIQTQGLEYASRYDGMMAQSATINVSPDDVANIDITFLGKDEIVTRNSENNVALLFEGHNTSNGGLSWVKSYTDNSAETVEAVANCPFDMSGAGAEDVGRIQKLKAGNAFNGTFDNFVDYYPSYNASLFVAKKVLPATSQGNETTPNFYYSSGVQATDGWTLANGTNIWNSETTKPGSGFLIPFSDLTITINNNLEFPSYINGTKNRTKPIQTTFREVTISATFPYNEFTTPLVRDVFGNQSFAMKLALVSDDGLQTVLLEMPEVCVTGDGGLGDIPEGEITVPLTFTAYSTVEMGVADTDISLDNTGYSAIADKPPLRVWVDES